jgi:hypothetical protein
MRAWPSPEHFATLRGALASAMRGPITRGYYVAPSTDPDFDMRSDFHKWLRCQPASGLDIRTHLVEAHPSCGRCLSCGEQVHHFDDKEVIVEIATLLLKSAAQDTFDRVILTARDRALEDAVAFVRRDLGKEVWLNMARANAQMALQSYADHVVWLEDVFGLEIE